MQYIGGIVSDMANTKTIYIDNELEALVQLEATRLSLSFSAFMRLVLHGYFGQIDIRKPEVERDVA